MAKKNPVCSFCGKEKGDALILIAGLEGHICDACVEQAGDIVARELRSDFVPETGTFALPENITPADIKSYLDQYIIGQNDAKKYLSVAVLSLIHI